MNCPICGTQASRIVPDASPLYECARCGTYKVSMRADAVLSHSPLSPLEAANISGWIRESGVDFIGADLLRALRTMRTPTVDEKAMKLLRYFARLNPSPGDMFILLPETEGSKAPPAKVITPHEALAVGWAKDDTELHYLIYEYLIAFTHSLSSPGVFRHYSMLKITPEGWQRIASGLDSTDSNTAFVAMWFNDEMLPAWTDAIQPGIKAAGYDPVRIDKKDHNNRIDDEIEAAIRRAKFLVADFTEQRGGVYYEAGLAKGQGKQVVWLCREDHFKEVHFDNNHYNFIIWTPKALDTLKSSLQHRIEATLGRGTLVAS